MDEEIIFEEVECSELKCVLNDLGYKTEIYKRNYFVNLKNYDAIVKIYEKSHLLYFESVLENLDYLKDNKELYRRLLEVNADIIPISIGIRGTVSEDRRIILAECLDTENLDENEIITVLDKFEENIPKIKKILNIFKK